MIIIVGNTVEWFVVKSVASWLAALSILSSILAGANFVTLFPHFGFIIFLPCDFYLLSIFMVAVADWMSTILPRMVWP